MPVAFRRYAPLIYSRRSMKLVPAVALALAHIVPTTASAEGLRPLTFESPRALGPVARAMLHETVPAPSPLSPRPAEIRLSSGAKTAIIVGAIVGGILIIVGVIALQKPGRL